MGRNQPVKTLCQSLFLATCFFLSRWLSGMAARAASVTEGSRWARRNAEHTTPIISLPFKKITLYSKPGGSASDDKHCQTGRLELKATTQHSHTQGAGQMSVLCPDPCASFLSHRFWMPPSPPWPGGALPALL